MNFSLTPELEQFVRSLAESGDYSNASEVVREALRLLKRAEERTQRLRAAIREGDEAASCGDHSDLHTNKDLDAFFAEI